MTFAVNVLGFPIYGVLDGGTNQQPRLQVDPANARRVIDPITGNIVATNAGTGNPELQNGDAIVQPEAHVLMQVMVDDAVRARFNNGALVFPARHHGAVVANFGRTPGRVNTNPLDYTTKEHLQLYREATKSVYRDGEATFDLSKGRLHGFLGKIGQRGQVAGWSFDIVVDPTAGTTKSLITAYGQIEVDQVRAKVAGFDGSHTLDVQHDEQIYSCLMASLSQGALDVLALKTANYRAPSGENSGLLLLKLIVMESTISTKSTSNHLWAKLTSGMPGIMAGHGNNITKFNVEIREIQEPL